MLRYVALVHKGRKEYGVSFPDFPGVVSGGTTLDEALMEAGEALRFAVTELRAEGNAVPPPRDLDAIQKAGDPWVELEGATAVFVPLLPPKSGAERINLTMEKGLVEAIDAAAGARDMSRSAWLAEAARARLIGG